MEHDFSENNRLAVWLGGFALGAVAMYLSDPSLGRQRRALAQEKIRDVSHKTSSAFNRTGGAINHAMQDTGIRLAALKEQAGSLMGRGKSVIDDQILETRIRARLARIVSQPSSIDVMTESGGCVMLSGSILADEKSRLLNEVRSIPGVTEIDDRLHTHSYNESASGLPARRYNMNAPYDEYNSSDIQTSVGMLGMLRRSPLSTILAMVGVGLLVRSLGSKNVRDLLSGESESDFVNLQKTIEIKASPETVFDIWAKYENFPQFLSHVVEVRDLGMQRSHWIVKGPGGTHIEWDAVLTKCLPPSMMAWQSEPGAEVENSGSVRFESANGGTRVTVRLSYRPPAGALGEAIAEIMGRDPERELETDLERMKNFIENNKLPREAVSLMPPSGQILH